MGFLDLLKGYGTDDSPAVENQQEATQTPTVLEEDKKSSSAALQNTNNIDPATTMDSTSSSKELKSVVTSQDSGHSGGSSQSKSIANGNQTETQSAANNNAAATEQADDSMPDVQQQWQDDDDNIDVPDQDVQNHHFTPIKKKNRQTNEVDDKGEGKKSSLEEETANTMLAFQSSPTIKKAPESNDKFVMPDASNSKLEEDETGVQSSGKDTQQAQKDGDEMATTTSETRLEVPHEKEQNVMVEAANTSSSATAATTEVKVDKSVVALNEAQGNPPPETKANEDGKAVESADTSTDKSSQTKDLPGIRKTVVDDLDHAPAIKSSSQIGQNDPITVSTGEGWNCHKCNTMNPANGKRCTKCKCWKGGHCDGLHRSGSPSSKPIKQEEGRRKRSPTKSRIMKECNRILSKLKRVDKTENKGIFSTPVDEDDNAPDYSKIIKEPCDFGTIQARLDANEIEEPEFHRLVSLVFTNALTYNPDTEHCVHIAALKLQTIYDKERQPKDMSPAKSRRMSKRTSKTTIGKATSEYWDEINKSMDAALVEESMAKIPDKLPYELDSNSGSQTLAENDIVLSMKDPHYKATMFKRFRKMSKERNTADNNAAADELLQLFKKGGGRFFRGFRGSIEVEEVGDQSALAKIKRDVTQRLESAKHWDKKEFKLEPMESPQFYIAKVERESNNMSEMANESLPQELIGIKSGRKRNKPQNFMAAQGQDMLVQEDLRKLSAAAKKRRGRGSNEMKPFSANENRAFEQGCTKYGWGNWNQVQTLVYDRTSEECEEYSIMILANYPDVKARLDAEHKKIWVYSDGKASTPPPEKASNQRKSSRARESSLKVKESADDIPQSTTPDASNRTFRGRKRSKSRKRDDDISGSEMMSATGRPKRQAAKQPRNKYSMSSGDESTVASRKSTASSTTSRKSAKRKLKRDRTALFSGLSTLPMSNGTYEEESAWRFHNPAFLKDSFAQLTDVRGNDMPNAPPPVVNEGLQPLPPSKPVPKLPETGFCKWSFDEKTRVLLANFRVLEGKITVEPEDEGFLFSMMERDDITVISEGLADSINSSLWTREYIEGCIGSEYHHKFRGFETKHKNSSDVDQQPAKQSKEKEGWYSMKVSDYFEYLEQRQSVKSNRLDENGVLNKNFTFTDSGGKEKTVNVDNMSLYMIDVDMVKLLPQAFEDFQQSFKLPGILPGGSHCMMNAVNANGRPFMGPNLYITPPSSFTHFHQDGHGTVDSGHLCLSGYNEVVMLRRLTERHKCNAIQILTGTSDSHNALYGLPHSDGLETSLGWPTNEAIGKCKKMGYYPSVFVLKPGQVVHINKGRLHAFRKLAPAVLQDTDCHYELRNQILETKESMTEDLCFSIAWDWMFKGVTSEGINREVSSILECSRLNREHDLASLAIPETTLLFLAKENIAKYQLEVKASNPVGNSLFAMNIPSHQSAAKSEPNAKTVLQGILPSIQYVVNRHNSSVKFSRKWEKKTKNVRDSWRVSIDSKPNTWQDPGTFSLDPYGASDFFCKFCSEELSNVYMHCDGCEKLLNKDFNICSNCHQEGRYKVKVLMHPFNTEPRSIHNHTGNPQHLRQSRCPCHQGKACQFCSYCTGCSCRCHQSFTLHYRFMEMGNELEILQNVENIVGSDAISHTAETKARLLSLMSDDLPFVDTVQPEKEDMICQIIDVPKKKEKPIQQQPQLPKKIAAKSPPGKEERPPKKKVQSTDQQPQKQPKKIDAKPSTPSEKKKSKASIPPKESRTSALEIGPEYKIPRKTKNNPNGNGKAPPAPSSAEEKKIALHEGEKKIALDEGTKTTPAIDESAAKQSAESHNSIKTEVDEVHQMNEQKEGVSGKGDKEVQQQPGIIDAKPQPGKKEVQSTDQLPQKQPQKQPKKIDAKPPTSSEKKKSKASIPPKESRTPAPEFGPGWTKYKIPRKNNKDIRSDQYYVSPKGERFRSKSEVERYLNNPNVDGKPPPVPPSERKLSLRGTKTTPAIDESAAKQPAESHNIKNKVDEVQEMNEQKDNKAQPRRLKEEGSILVNEEGDEDKPMITMSTTKRKRGDQRGRVSLEVAANSGCTKCKKELESGNKTKSESHSNQCPRKMWGKKSRSTAAAIGGTLPDTTQVKQQKKRPRQADNSHTVSEGRKLRSMSDSSSALSNSARPDFVHSSAQVASFHCDKCDKDIKFPKVETAGEEFTNHVKECEDSKTRNKKRMRRSSRSITRDNSMSSLSTNSLPGPLPDEVVSRPRVTRGRSVQLAVGQRVLVWCDKTNDHWKATILGRKEKNGSPGYNIHWEGTKRKEKGKQDWVPSDDITANNWQ